MSRQYIRAILHMSCTIEKPMGLSRAAWGPLWCGTLALLMETHLQEQERKCQLLMPVSMASDGSIQCTNLHELHHDHKGFLRVRPVELLPGLHDLGVAGGQVDGGCAVLVVLPKRHQLGGQRKQMQFSLYGKDRRAVLCFGGLWPITSSIYPDVITQSLQRVEMRMDGASQAPTLGCGSSYSDPVLLDNIKE